MDYRFINRSTIHWNTAWVMTLSLVFPHLLIALAQGQPPQSPELIQEHLRHGSWYIALWLVALIQVIRGHPLSRYLVPLYFSAGFISTLHVFFNHIDKTVLIFDLLYILIAYFVSLLWSRELHEAYSNPLMDHHDIGDRVTKIISCTVISAEGTPTTGILSNWSHDGVFIRFHSTLSPAYIQTLTTAHPRARIEFHFLNRTFSQEAILATLFADGQGAGFRFVECAEYRPNVFDWSDLHAILTEMQLVPEYLT